MKNLIRIFLIVVIVGAGISIGSSCSDENDCSLAGTPMMYCTLYTIDEITDLRVNDTLDSLTITALGTDSIYSFRTIFGISKFGTENVLLHHISAFH